MAGDLILNSLEIQRFRCFRELRIERLGRVNLIVGKNNVGKSTLLEALRLFARPAAFSDFLEVLVSRNELSRAEIQKWERAHVYPRSTIDSLFFGRKALPGAAEAIVIGPISSPDEAFRIVFETIYRRFQQHAQNSRNPEQLANQYRNHEDLGIRMEVASFRLGLSVRRFPCGEISLANGPKAGNVDITASDESEFDVVPIRTLPFHWVGPNGLSPNEGESLWDEISLSPAETSVVTALRIISPELQAVTLKNPADRSEATSSEHEKGPRIPFAKVEGFDQPLPLRALGDGVNRLFGLSLALVNARGGLLLVDEIENGIHYSVQADLWRSVFETAARLNVQVFATTHSYDCIKAFEEAARESEEEGVLVRLARKGDRTLVGEFDERELEIAVEGEIEVR